MPVLHLLAGSNGAGKSSYVRDVLMPTTHLSFINADEIAAKTWPDAQAEHAYEAARIAEAQRRDRIADGASFISETVFSHPSKVQLVADCIEAGYLVHLHVITVPIDLTARKVDETVPGARLVEYEDGAHGIFASHKQQLIDDLLDFLDSGVAGDSLKSAIPLNISA